MRTTGEHFRDDQATVQGMFIIHGGLASVKYTVFYPRSACMHAKLPRCENFEAEPCLVKIRILVLNLAEREL